MRVSLSSSHALLEMKCDMQISYEMVSNAHVRQLTVNDYLIPIGLKLLSNEVIAKICC